jgi:phosphate acetyltransferase/phosphate butyryltransferase
MSEHPRLTELVARARERARHGAPALALVHPGDALAMQAAAAIRDAGIARPLLVGEHEEILSAAAQAEVDVGGFEIVATATGGPAAAKRATALARDGVVAMLMKGSLHTDELMSAVVAKTDGLRGEGRITHAFVFDLPRYHKLLALADCVVNIAPNPKTKQHIVGNAVRMLQALGIKEPKVGVVAAVESVNPAIPATLDAQALVQAAAQGAWPGAIVEGPFGFDNAFSAEAARIKKITSRVAGDADLLIMPELNAGNMLYKSFVYVGGGDCAGLVLGAKVPIVLTSRADSAMARLASVALGVLTAG